MPSALLHSIYIGLLKTISGQFVWCECISLYFCNTMHIRAFLMLKILSIRLFPQAIFPQVTISPWILLNFYLSWRCERVQPTGLQALLHLKSVTVKGYEQYLRWWRIRSCSSFTQLFSFGWVNLGFCFSKYLASRLRCSAQTGSCCWSTILAVIFIFTK